MLRYIFPFAALVLVLALACAAGCTGGPTIDGTGGGGSGGEGAEDPRTAPESCQSHAGTWGLIGGCPNSSCELTQTGCSIAITCESGMALSGNLSGDSGFVSGTSGEEELGFCSIHFLEGKSFNLSCGVCNGSGSRR